ncbi:MAG: LamG-like jellyroll fold domain-containing protein, partial [Planctomycetaceae bacterium]
LTETWQSIYFKGGSPDSETRYRENTFWINQNGSLQLAAAPDGAASQTVLSTDPNVVTTGRWYHFATVLDTTAGMMQIYLDGSLQKQEVFDSTFWIEGQSDSLSPPPFSHWAPGEPNSFEGDNEDYLELEADGGWNDLEGTALRSYILKTAAGFEFIEGPYTFAAAKSDAASRGGQMAWIGSQADQNAVTLAAAGRPVWINGTDSETEGTWRRPANVIQNTTTPWKFGGNPSYSGLSGTIDEIAIYDRALTEDQIVAQVQSRWIAGTDSAIEGDWKWINGGVSETLFWFGNERKNYPIGGAFVNWIQKNGEYAAPNNWNPDDNEEDVAMMDSDGFWDDVNEEGVWENDSYTGLAYVLETTHGHRLINREFTFAEAWWNAYQQGGWIATVDNAAEQETISQVANGTEIWLGASDARTEAVWRWLEPNYESTAFDFDNNPSSPLFADLPKWGSNEPNGDTQENFAKMFPTGRWGDAENDLTQPYLAAKKKFKFTNSTMHIESVISTQGNVRLEAYGDIIADTVTANEGDVTLHVDGDLTIQGRITAGLLNQVVWRGTGQILGAGAGTVAIKADALFVDGDGGLGTPETALTVDVGHLRGSQFNGPIHMHNSGDLVIGDITVTTGDLWVMS